jgi:hypothetical protein
MVGAASERAASFARHLPGLGWDVSVVTVERGLFHTDAANTPPPVATTRTRSPEPSRMIARLRGGGGGEAGLSDDAVVGGSSGLARQLVREFVYVPDGQALWIPFAARAARAAIREAGSPPVLLTTSVPYSAHLAGRRAARRTGVPWAAEFRDPWAHVDQAIRPRSGARQRVDELLERRVVEAADLVIVTSDSTCERFRERYPREPAAKFAVVRNGFEPAAAAGPAPPRQGPLTLVHAGSVPAHAPIEPLLRGIEAAARREPGSIELHVYSSPERWRNAAQGLEAGWLHLHGLVTPADARAAVARSSAAILICPGDDYDEHVSAKLLEYLGARRPVVAAVSPTSEMAALGRAYGDVRILPDYAAEPVTDAVVALLDEHRAGKLEQPVESERPVTDLTRAEQSRRLADLLCSLV